MGTRTPLTAKLQAMWVMLWQKLYLDFAHVLRFLWHTEVKDSRLISLEQEIQGSLAFRLQQGYLWQLFNEVYVDNQEQTKQLSDCKMF